MKTMQNVERSATVRFGIVGLGTIGRRYLRHLLGGDVTGARLTAVSDTSAGCEADARDAGVAFFGSAEAMFASGVIDSVIVATPAYCRAGLIESALQHGLGVVADKPVGLHVAEAQALSARVERHGLPVSVMFNHRTDPAYRYVRDLVATGSLGRLVRIAWYVSHYFRTDAYYAGSPWRGTWQGEGGGVLMNQCHHHVDLFVWLFGMPERVRAFAREPRRHAIEVDDSVTAYLCLPDGCEATLVASTHDFPKRDRLEIVGSQGAMVKEYSRIELSRFSCDTLQMIATNCDPSTKVAPDLKSEQIVFPDRGTQHVGVLRNHVKAFHGCAAVIAEWQDGVHALHLSNAIAHSAFEDRWVDLPLCPQAFHEGLQRRIAAAGNPVE